MGDIALPDLHRPEGFESAGAGRGVALLPVRAEAPESSLGSRLEPNALDASTHVFVEQGRVNHGGDDARVAEQALGKA